ncbi:MAG TPA: Bax inhibitor-1/YccA family protein [Euzebya sp.]|nr:Bax inhibitor-1/YccA family protein [Euzebya sp.]
MRTSNPTLSESAFQRLGGSQGQGGYGYTAPTQPGYAQGPMAQTPYGSGTQAAPYAQTDRFTVEGAIYKTAFLLGLLVVSAVMTMLLLPDDLFMIGIIGGALTGFVLALVIIFKANLAPALSPVYALVEGVFLGAITVLFEQDYPGIATQALVGTMGVLGVMLVLYRTGVVKVTQRFRMIVATATGAIMVTYLLSFVLSFAGIEFGFLRDSSMLSIGISLLVIGVAAANLALDFDFIENAAARGLPERAEWYAAFGLLVTLVWLYLEILRLLAKLNRR